MERHRRVGLVFGLLAGASVLASGCHGVGVWNERFVRQNRQTEQWDQNEGLNKYRSHKGAPLGSRYTGGIGGLINAGGFAMKWGGANNENLGMVGAGRELERLGRRTSRDERQGGDVYVDGGGSGEDSTKEEIPYFRMISSEREGKWGIYFTLDEDTFYPYTSGIRSAIRENKHLSELERARKVWDYIHRK